MNDLDFQRQYWDSVAREKDFTLKPCLGCVLEHLKPGARILDYGCGYGRVAAELAALGHDGVVGVDASPELIKRGLGENPDLDLRSMDGLPLSFADGSFDAVLLVAVLTCIPGSAAQGKLMAEISRLLRPGGLVYVADFLINDDARNLDRYERCAATYGTYGVFELDEGAVLRHHDPAYIEKLTAAFRRIDLEQTVTKTMNGHQSKAFHYCGQKP